MKRITETEGATVIEHVDPYGCRADAEQERAEESPEDFFGPVISGYSRAQAIEAKTAGRKTMKEQLTGAHHALCANSFFRHRHDKVKRFARARKRRNQEQTVSLFKDYIRCARAHAADARRLGWRGTFLQAAEAIGATGQKGKP